MLLKELRKITRNKNLLFLVIAFMLLHLSVKICNKNKWLYIFNLKPNRLKEINSAFEKNLLLENETTIKNFYYKY